MTHSDILGTLDETTRSVTDRIMSVWTRGSQADRQAGAVWYPTHEQLVDHLAGRAARTREAVAAVLAHLSPRTSWARAILGSRQLLIKGTSMPGLMGANVARARAAMATTDPLATLNGPKTRRFALNLLGDSQVVTVDIWAVRVALGDQYDGNVLRAAGMYEAIEHCYRLAARRVGVHPVTMQATTWITARNGRAD